MGSRNYREWQTLAFEATTDREEVSPEMYEGPTVDQRSYPMPRKIIKREEAKDRTVDEFQPNRNVIDEDLMQNIDKNENEDRVMKNDQRSIKVLVAEHTKDEMQDDEYTN